MGNYVWVVTTCGDFYPTRITTRSQLYGNGHFEWVTACSKLYYVILREPDSVKGMMMDSSDGLGNATHEPGPKKLAISNMRIYVSVLGALNYSRPVRHPGEQVFPKYSQVKAAVIQLR